MHRLRLASACRAMRGAEGDLRGGAERHAKLARTVGACSVTQALRKKFPGFLEGVQVLACGDGLVLAGGTAISWVASLRASRFVCSPGRCLRTHRGLQIAQLFRLALFFR